MSAELLLDNSKEVFQLDKDVLSFRLDTEDLSEVISKKLQKSENDVKVKNITDDYIAFRTKTTKKAYYSVEPVHCVIPPKGEQIVKISFSAKEGERIKLHGHKFRFEGFVIPADEKDKNAKDIFNEYTQKGVPVVGNSQRTFVQFSDNNENEITSATVTSKKSSGNLLSLPTTHARTPSDISEYAVTDEVDSNQNNENKTTLMDKIQSTEDQKITLSDMLTGNSVGTIQEEKKEVVETIGVIEDVKEDKKEEINNNDEVNNKKEVNPGLTLSEKIVEQPQPETKLIEEEEKKVEQPQPETKLVEEEEKKVEQPQPETKLVEEEEKKVETKVKEEPAKKTNLEVKEQNVFENQKGKIKNKVYEEDIKNIPDVFIFASVFALMLIGYYLVK